MARELKSFKRDWQRWTAGERVFAVLLLAGAGAVLTGPVSLLSLF